MRVALRSFVVVALAALVVASPAAASTDPQLLFDPVDQAWAEAIILDDRDVGLTWRSMESDRSGDPRDHAVCPGVADESDLTITGGNASDFVRADGGAFLMSSVTIWQSPEQAQADWDRSLQPLLTCVADGLRSASTKKIKVVVTGKRALSYPALAPRTAAFRFSIAYRTTVKTKKKRRIVSVGATFDVIMVGNGRATAVLALLAFNKVPVSDAAKLSYAAKLAKRMTVDPVARRP
jgi:hypothetical protein